jgi:hypothetical protein
MKRGELLADLREVEMMELNTPTNATHRDRGSDDDVHATLVEAQAAARKHPGVLADGWLAYFKRAVPHFFIGESGDRCVASSFFCHTGWRLRNHNCPLASLQQRLLTSNCPGPG